MPLEMKNWTDIERSFLYSDYVRYHYRVNRLAIAVLHFLFLPLPKELCRREFGNGQPMAYKSYEFYRII